MNPAFLYEVPPQPPCSSITRRSGSSGINSSGSSSGSIARKNPRIRKRSGSISSRMMPTTPTTKSTMEDVCFSKISNICTKAQSQSQSQQQQQQQQQKQPLHDNTEKREPIGFIRSAASQSQSRGIAIPQSLRLSNLRTQLNYSFSSSSSSESSSASKSPNKYKSKNNKKATKSPPTPVARAQKYNRPDIFRQNYSNHATSTTNTNTNTTATTPLHRPFKQQRSFSFSPSPLRYETDWQHAEQQQPQEHPLQKQNLQQHLQQPQLQHQAKPSKTSHHDHDHDYDYDYYSSSSVSNNSECESPPTTPLPPLWTEDFAKGLADSLKGLVDRMIEEGNLPQQQQQQRSTTSRTRKFWSRLKPQDVVSVRSTSMPESEFGDDSYDSENDDVLGCGSFSSVTRVRIRGKGSKEFALKHLKPDLLPSKLTPHSLQNGSVTAFTRAAKELAREAYLLSRFDHPNIVTIAGWAQGGVLSYATLRRHDAFFLLLELLQEETLDDRIERWNHDDALLCANNNNNNNNNTCTSAQDNSNKFKLRCTRRKIEQLTICRQVAGALAYLHSKNVVYRDLKPQNIGFATNKNNDNIDTCREENDNGSNVVVKLMDFGLARKLPFSSSGTGTGTITEQQQHQHQHQHQQQPPRSPKNNAHNNNSNNNNTSLFDMTGTVGTLRYMAPEVCLHRPYGLECDIYSWSIVAHEILSQQKPYEDMTPDTYQSLVCQQGVRPCSHMMLPNNDASTSDSASATMPSEYTVLLTQAWRNDPSKRLPLHLIQRQLDLFLQKEKLMWEAQELLSGMPDCNESPITHSRSFAENSSNTYSDGGGYHGLGYHGVGHHGGNGGAHHGGAHHYHHRGGRRKESNHSNKRSWNQYASSSSTIWGNSKSHNGIFPNFTMHNCYDGSDAASANCVSPTRNHVTNTSTDGLTTTTNTSGSSYYYDSYTNSPTTSTNGSNNNNNDGDNNYTSSTRVRNNNNNFVSHPRHFEQSKTETPAITTTTPDRYTNYKFHHSQQQQQWHQMPYHLQDLMIPQQQQTTRSPYVSPPQAEQVDTFLSPSTSMGHNSNTNNTNNNNGPWHLELRPSNSYQNQGYYENGGY